MQAVRNRKNTIVMKHFKTVQHTWCQTQKTLSVGGVKCVAGGSQTDLLVVRIVDGVEALATQNDRLG